MIALFLKMKFTCANKPQLKQTSLNVHSRGLVKWKHAPLICVTCLYRNDSLSQTHRQKTWSWGGARAMGLHSPTWGGNGSMPSCSVMCCKFSCKNHRDTTWACLRAGVIKFSWATGSQKAYELQRLCIRQFYSQISPTSLLHSQYFMLYSSFHMPLIVFIKVCLCSARGHLLVSSFTSWHTAFFILWPARHSSALP